MRPCPSAREQLPFEATGALLCSVALPYQVLARQHDAQPVVLCAVEKRQREPAWLGDGRAARVATLPPFLDTRRRRPCEVLDAGAPGSALAPLEHGSELPRVSRNVCVTSGRRPLPLAASTHSGTCPSAGGIWNWERRTLTRKLCGRTSNGTTREAPCESNGTAAVPSTSRSQSSPRSAKMAANAARRRPGCQSASSSRIRQRGDAAQWRCCSIRTWEPCTAPPCPCRHSSK